MPMNREATLDTANLEGRDLDYAVMLAMGYEVAERPSHWKCDATFAFFRGKEDICPTCSTPHYSEGYEAEKVLSIMEEEQIAVHPNAVGGWVAYNDAGKNDRGAIAHPQTWVGSSVAEAVLRCFVGSKFGDTVEQTWPRP